MQSFRSGARLAVVLLLALAGWSHAKTQQKSNKEWAKLSDKDWDRIADEWDSDEEKEEYEYKPPQRKGIDMEKLQKAKGKEHSIIASLMLSFQLANQNYSSEVRNLNCFSGIGNKFY